MASKTFFAFVAQALLIQAAFAQWVGNSEVDNNIVINSGASGLGWAGGLGLNSGLAGGLGVAGLGNGIGLANGLAGVNVVSAGLGANLGGQILNNGLGLGAGLGLGNAVVGGQGFIDLVGVSGGGVLPISSVGPVVPAGLTVVSDNAIDGAVLVSGQLPFLSAVAFEGALSSAGSGAASCGCGNGNIGIVSETGSAALLPAAAGLGAAGLGLGATGLGLGAAGLGLGTAGLGLGGLAGLNGARGLYL